jgi:hypothetical protein
LAHDTPDYWTQPDGTLHFTRRGQARYRPRFARAGIALSRLHTREAFQYALRESFDAEWQQLIADFLAGPGSRLERALVAAVAQGDWATASALEARLARRNAAALSRVDAVAHPFSGTGSDRESD